MNPVSREEAPVDFLIITALEEERAAVLAKLPDHRKLDRDPLGAHTYYEATVGTRRRDGATYRVLVTSLSGMGPIKGAIKASAVIHRWRPAHVLLVGIAGGVAGEVAPGDVMVANQVVDYTVGKVRDGAPREERWVAYLADANLLDAAGNFPTGWEDLVGVAPPVETAPGRHVGVIASGGDVVASAEQIRTFLADWPKLIGVEMEGGGVAAGLHDDIERPRFLMIRGVSDLASGDDNAGTKKAWRRYACHVAAAYAIGLLRDGPVGNDRRQGPGDVPRAGGGGGDALPAIGPLLSLDPAGIRDRVPPLAAVSPSVLWPWCVEFVHRSGGSLRTLAVVRDLVRASWTLSGQPIGRVAADLLTAASLSPPLPPLDWVEVGLGARHFWMLRYPVTRGVAWRLFPSLRLGTGSAEPDLPLTNLSLAEAATVADVLGGRLPTLEEMDLAGWRDRRGAPRLYPWGDTPDPRRSNCLEQELGGVCEVSRHDALGASAWGIADLAGNVWEWSSTPSTTAGSGIVVGGSYLHLQRASLRGFLEEYDADRSLSYVGFRAVREP
jgi:nucleoside phosphorylase